jgi:small nuclear ribonucleoprotein (snRNP)-like protein
MTKSIFPQNCPNLHPTRKSIIRQNPQNSLLSKACNTNNIDVVKYLLVKGADVNEDDDSPLFNEGFTLEVSSPGIERALTLPRHWTKNLTRIIKVSLADGSEVSGRLAEFDEVRAILIENIKGRMKTHEVKFAEIKKANVEIEFNRKDEI